ncbi:MAG: hypothetical protein WCI73_02545 [Phycisphaerae bacterium]
MFGTDDGNDAPDMGRSLFGMYDRAALAGHHRVKIRNMLRQRPQGFGAEPLDPWVGSPFPDVAGFGFPALGHAQAGRLVRSAAGFGRP